MNPLLEVCHTHTHTPLPIIRHSQVSTK